MARSVFVRLLLVVILFGQSMMASPNPRPSFDDQTSGTTATKKQADNPKKPTQAKNPSAAEKVKTDDRMSTRGLKPPPKDADKDKNTKPDAKPDTTNPK